IFIDNDLPVSDPITFRNLFAQNTGAIVHGKTKVLRTSHASAVQVLDRGDNIPWAITDNSLATANGWANFLGQMIIVTSGPSAGSRAFIMKDLGSKQAQLSQWVAGSIDGTIFSGTFPGSPPNPGDKFQIVDFTVANLGSLAIGFIAPPGDKAPLV